MMSYQIKYKSFEEIDKEKEWWRVPFVSELLQRYGLDSALRKLFGSETVPARQFVEYAFGQLKSFNDVNALRDRLFKGYNKDSNKEEMTSSDRDVPDISLQTQTSSEVPSDDTSQRDEKSLGEISPQKATTESGQAVEPMTTVNKPVESDKDFWKDFSYILNQNVVQKLGLPVPEKLKWDGLDILNKVGLQSQKMAEAGYIESGLATPEEQNLAQDKQSDQQTKSSQSPLPDIKKATQDLLRQTDSVFGALMVLAATVSELNKGGQKNEQEEDSASEGENDFSRSPALEKLPQYQNGSVLDDKKAEEMRALFLTAESAMEAWAMLSTSLGHPSFIKSEFEKVCFLDNATTDTQAAIWRDSARRRLVVAFRGTEQAKWKDLLTDLMLVPAGLNPERIGGDFKQELQVHSGFLSAYDSVRMRIISLIKLAIGYTDEASDATQKWNAYVTGHSLGGALATLLSLELSSSQLAKSGAISVTMYNFGSPRVGNRRFADVYNEKVKDSWRVVNHRDIIPTVPRLMGYCHVAQPVYLAPGELKDALEEMDLWKDGYQGDVIGEYTPDVLVTEFMKGEKELIQKILQTEINIFRAIRDGSALMQHMEDFYYITLLESVRSNYQTIAITARN